MDADLWIGFLCVAVFSWTIGIVMGRNALVTSLTICEDRNGVTGPHCLKGRFYYLVGESFYVRDKQFIFQDTPASTPKEG